MLMNKYFKLAGKQTIVLLGILPIAALIEISVSYLLQLITDSATGHVHLAYNALVAVVIGYMLTDALVYFGSSYLEQRVLNKIDNRVRLRLSQSLLQERTGLGVDSQKLATDYYNIFTNTLDVLHNDYLQGGVNAYKQLCQFIIAMGFSIMIQPVFSLIIVILCLPALGVPLLQRRVLKHNKTQVLRAAESYTHSLQNIINGIRTIQLFSLRPVMQAIFQRKSGQLLRTQNRDQLRRKEVGGISQLLDNILYLGTWVVGIYFVMHKSVTLGQLVAFSQLMIFISEPIQSASGLLGDIVGGKQAAQEISQVIAVKNEGTQGLPLSKFQELAYDQVSFSDGNRVVLQNIALRMKAHQRYLIVGKSGSGKSSLINVPFSPDVPLTGRLLINQQPRQDYADQLVYQHLGILEQRSYIFDASIRQNLALFDDQMSEKKLIAMLKHVGLSVYASSTGLHTKVADQGNSLSGGERKRLALGRMLLRNYDFVFLDEPLTGLDPKTAQDIIAILLANNQFGWAMVTHQFDEALFSAVDQIFVVDEGKITAAGPLSNPRVQTGLHQLELI